MSIIHRIISTRVNFKFRKAFRLFTTSRLFFRFSFSFHIFYYHIVSFPFSSRFMSLHLRRINTTYPLERAESEFPITNIELEVSRNATQRIVVENSNSNKPPKFIIISPAWREQNIRFSSTPLLQRTGIGPLRIFIATRFFPFLSSWNNQLCECKNERTKERKVSVVNSTTTLSIFSLTIHGLFGFHIFSHSFSFWPLILRTLFGARASILSELIPSIARNNIFHFCVVFVSSGVVQDNLERKFEGEWETCAQFMFLWGDSLFVINHIKKGYSIGWYWKIFKFLSFNNCEWS